MAFDLQLLDASPGRDGWLELKLAGVQAPRLLVKLGERDGRVGVVRLIVDGDIDSQTLRDIPLGRVEALLRTNYGPLLAVPRDHEPNALEELKRRRLLFPDEFEQIDAALDRYFEGTAQDRRVPLTWKGPREPLTRPDGTDPDGFSRRVAEAYREALSSSSSPAVALAAEADVPVTTVHRWIAEARRRGHLPPARKGRAG